MWRNRKNEKLSTTMKGRTTLRVLLEGGADETSLSEDGTPPLHHACANHVVHSVKLLLTRGADVSAVDAKNETALCKVMTSFNAEIMRMLIEAGATLDVTRHDGSTPLHVACEQKCLATVALLLDRGVDVNSVDKRGDTPLCTALSACRQVHGADSDGSMATWEVGREDVVSRLDINAVDAAGRERQPVQKPRLSCSPTDFERALYSVVFALVEAGANVLRRGHGGCSPLHLACRKADLATVRLLLARGADVEGTDDQNNTALHAALGGDLSPERHGVVRALVAAGAYVSAPGGGELTPLHLACHWGDLGVARLLLEAGADASAQDVYRNAPLHVAMTGARVPAQVRRDLVLCLVDAGADVRAVGKDGLAPLHLACHAGDHSVAERLIQHGAEVNAETHFSCSPLHFTSRLSGAKAREQAAIFDLLLAAGADARMADGDGNTALHHACAEANLASVRRLLASRAMVNATNHKVETPLHRVTYNSDRLVGSALLEAGADIDAKDSGGETPLGVACDAEWYLYRPDYIELLISRQADTSCLLRSCGSKANQSFSRVERICQKTSVEYVNRLCEFDIPLPPSAFVDCAAVRERRPGLAVVLSRAGLDCVHSVWESVLSLLRLQMPSTPAGAQGDAVWNTWLRLTDERIATLLSCYVEFLMAASPFKGPHLQQVIASEMNTIPNDGSRTFIQERCLSAASLRTWAVYATRGRMWEVSGRRSILPRIAALRAYVPPGVVDTLRLTAETDALLGQLKALETPVSSS